MSAPSRLSRPLPSVLASAYRLDQIIPAQPGWRAVCWDGVRHQTAPVYMLGLATNEASSTPGLIVSVTYLPATGWVCAETDPTFCGLLPPGWDLGAYEQLDPHGHVPVTP